MATILLDTNIVSFTMNEHSLALEYQIHTRGQELVISFMTVAELYEGAYRSDWDDKRLRRLETTLGRYIVIPYSQQLARTWARIRTERRKQPISVDDAWIAAAALEVGCPLVTHNPKDFRGISELDIITQNVS